MADRTFSIGVDYGTNSVRALVVDTQTGEEIGTSVFPYPSGDAGILLDERDPNLARQRPSDYIEGFFASVGDALEQAKGAAGFDASRVVGIGVDTTGSTPIPTDENGTPLADHERFKDDLNAQAWLWKDHTGFAEAAEITDRARSMGLPYLDKCGGVYSSEWFWSKVLHCIRFAPEVAEAAYSWIECADYIPAYLTGNLAPNKAVRGICPAGHKAMFHADWGGLPSKDFLTGLDPRLAQLRDRLYDQAVPSDQPAGRLTQEVAARTGLPVGIPVAAGAFDAHHGAVGSGVRPGTLVKIMGTSSCDMTVVPIEGELPNVPGLCGIVPGSIIPGMLGVEAGQSAVGDLFNWFVTHLCPAEYADGDPHANLSREAAKLRVGQSGLLALDWNNGNRTILVDPLLTGLLVGQTLHTSAPEVYRALIEATAFGALTIIRRIEKVGVAIQEVVTGGGIAEKSPLTMQIYADVLNRPIRLSRSAQTCALGAAVFGAVVGGAHPNTEAAQDAMTGLKETVYAPQPWNASAYDPLFRLYATLHDSFGTQDFSGSLAHVMKALIAIRQSASLPS